ncbi:transcription factor RFX4-like [Amphiura filiformis]|uniref:transcription factor RFX4-like n=1 Tax=Amphiura filiformis TaxID=82378 RepID=UPI003B21905F
MDFNREDTLGSTSASSAANMSGIESDFTGNVSENSLDSAYMSSYTCINVDDAQYYFPNKLQVVLTLQWLTSNYEPVEGVSIPRCSIYKHYTEFCKKQDFQPVNAASFGKVIKQLYPELKPRRLGTRGQSKYHYHGIRVKASSPYYKELSASQRESTPFMPLSPFKSPGGAGAAASYTMYDRAASTPNSKQTQAKITKPQLPEDRVSDFLLPEFPDAEKIQLGDSTLIGKVDSFLETYRTHCQKLLNTVLNSKLEEVHFHIERFWHELSGTSQQLLEIESVALTIAVCDKLLYQTIISILMPGIIQHLLPSLLHAIRHFCCSFLKHLEGALLHQPQILVDKKLEVAKDFANLLKRKTSLSHLAQAMCTVLRTAGSVKQMLHDWKKRTELSTVRSQLLWLVDSDDGPDKDTINKYLCEFVCLLDKHITVEDHLKWLDSVRKRCMAKYDHLDPEERSPHERRFMLQFCYLSNLIIRDQTLRSATSFGNKTLCTCAAWGAGVGVCLYRS